MSPNPTLTVLSSMQRHGVRSLLMGGQACVFYGAAEFSRDVDFAIHAEPGNLRRLRAALDHLLADVVAVPPFKEEHLRSGHAVHFRCRLPSVAGMRVDVMSHMRGVDPFPLLWDRRTTIEVDGARIDLLSLPDLVAAKKTQRSKDWPMIQRLVEANWFQHQHEATPDRIDFWLLECRTPEILLKMTERYRQDAIRLEASRPVLSAALKGDLGQVEAALEAERRVIVAADRAYWMPLRKELEQLRHPPK